jgi:hypothetical protein
VLAAKNAYTETSTATLVRKFVVCTATHTSDFFGKMDKMNRKNRKRAIKVVKADFLNKLPALKSASKMGSTNVGVFHDLKNVKIAMRRLKILAYFGQF